jgi:hypothetical protein
MPVTTVYFIRPTREESGSERKHPPPETKTDSLKRAPIKRKPTR